MSFLATLENFASAAVKDVEAVGAKIGSVVGEVEAVVTDAEQWVVNSAPQLSDALETVLEALGAANTAVIPETVAVVTAVEALLAKLADLLPAA